MNQENFKLRILRQFRREHSHIRWLMLTTQPSSSPLTEKSAYRRYFDFFASEFRLGIAVTMCENATEKPSFQVQFFPLDDDFKVTLANRRFDLSDKFIMQANYYEELITIQGAGIDFKMRNTTLAVNNYNYDIATQNETTLFTLYLKDGKITKSRDLEPILDRMLERYRHAESTGVYSQFIFTKKLSESLKDAMNQAGLSTQKKERLLMLFENSTAVSDTPSMVRIIQGLCQPID